MGCRMPQTLDFSFRDVNVVFDGSRLKVSNSKSSREWKLLNGWCTEYLAAGNEIVTSAMRPDEITGGSVEDTVFHEDWNVTACRGAAELVSVECNVLRRIEQLPETSFVRVSSVFHYPESGIKVKHLVDCHPDVAGVRTCLGFKSDYEVPADGNIPEMADIPSFVSGYAESLPVNGRNFNTETCGFFCDSQHRYTLDAPITAELHSGYRMVSGSQSFAGCSILVEYSSGGSGFILVKESHKCVNSPGIYTGEYVVKDGRLMSTGLGFSGGAPHWLSGDEYHYAWAHWCIPFTDYRDCGLYVKRFDRARYPFWEERDMFIAMNTWGSRGSGEYSRSAADEENVLRELESCARLGIDLLQIDDGWQFAPGTADFQNCKWTPSPERFPHGWSKVKARADELGVKLGLWAPPDFVTAEQIIANIKEGGFRRIKLDFLHLTRRDKLDDIMKMAEQIVNGSDEPVGINWDITEASPRLGFYYGREFGNIFLQNCENSHPGKSDKSFISYDPAVTLNQAWRLSRFFNLNQVQITIQRVAESARAKGYGQDYACGIALMGNPLFFMETCRFSPEERKQVHSVLKVYREHRRDILNGMVYPVLNEPDGNSWTGFKCITRKNTIYMTVFRELGSVEDSCNLEIEKGAEPELLYGPPSLRINCENSGTCEKMADLNISGLLPGGWAFVRIMLPEEPVEN